MATDSTPYVVIWKTRIGYRVRVLGERTGTPAAWRPTLATARRYADTKRGIA